MGKTKKQNKASTDSVHAQMYAHFGMLTKVLYQFPAMYAAIVGGLWYFATSKLDSNPVVSVFVFIYACYLSYILKKVTSRFRPAYSMYIDRLNILDGDHAVTLKSEPAQLIETRPKGEEANPKPTKKSKWSFFDKNSELSTIALIEETLSVAQYISICAVIYALTHVELVAKIINKILCLI